MQNGDASISVAIEDRHRAVLQLDVAAPGAIDEFMHCLADPSWRVRKAGLGRIRDFCKDDRRREKLAAELIKGLAAPDNVGLRNICAEALLRVGEPAIDALGKALHLPNNNLRKFVAEVIGTIGTVAAQTVLIEALNDSDENVRSASYEALGRIGGSTVVDTLRARLIAGGPEAELQDTAYLLDALQRAGAVLDVSELNPCLARRALH